MGGSIALSATKALPKSDRNSFFFLRMAVNSNLRDGL